jgi:thioredoxin 1
MAPAVNAMGQAYQDLAVVKVNLTEKPEFGHAFGIKALPTFIFFKDGQPIKQLEGQHPFHVLDGFVKEQLNG